MKPAKPLGLSCKMVRIEDFSLTRPFYGKDICKTSCENVLTSEPCSAIVAPVASNFRQQVADSSLSQRRTA